VKVINQLYVRNVKHVVSNQSHFTSFQVSVLTTVLEHSQVITVPKTVIRESMYPSWVPQKTRLICTPGTDKTNPLHSYQGVQVLVQAWTPSPQHLRPGLSMVLRPPPNTHPLKGSPERAKTHDKRVTSLPAPISKYVLRIISL
jgi:hypothetical protein